MEELDRLNREPFQKLPGSRLSVFLETEKDALRPLPASRFEYAEWKTVKAGMDYHENDAINFQMNRWYSFGCIGYDELMAAGKKIKNFDDWTNEFCLLAEQAKEKGDLVACATYLRAAQFFTLGDTTDENGEPLKLSLYAKCMLKLFEVTGFKNFENTIQLDFSDVRDYKFNNSCVTNGLLSKLIVYGKNSVGKSNLGLALFDIVSHLTTNNVTPGLYDYYLNVNNKAGYAEFHYVFTFDSGEVDYRYRKNDKQTLVYESVAIDGKRLFTYDYEDNRGDLTGLEALTTTLNLSFRGSDSILKYAINNSALPDDHPLYRMQRFVSHMSSRPPRLLRISRMIALAPFSFASSIACRNKSSVEGAVPVSRRSASSSPQILI